MTRSIPSIIVLTLMCFTISYGLVRFPDAGILDAASVRYEVADSSPDRQTSISMKPTADGSALQQDESLNSTVLPAQQAPTSELFVTESENPTTNGVADNPENNASDSSVNPEPKSDMKSESNSDFDKPKEKRDASLKVDEPAKKPKNNAKTSESVDDQLPGLTPESNDKSANQEDPLAPIGVPDNDKSMEDNSLPIETENPLPMIDPINTNVPAIVVDNNPSDVESKMDEPEQDALSIPEMEPETEQSVDEYWENYLNENSPSNSLTTNKDNLPTDSDSSSATTAQTPKASEPAMLKTDPNAQNIPPRNRETKPANKDALTLPALDEPQNDSPNASQPETGTIPMESFPLDASTTQKVNYVVDYQQEPYDSFGINVPETGQIIVKRLPPIENSVDPIYNNAQLDRFAL